ncbi:sensor histidine kinase [Nitrincola sp. MINF-07-Sa-05]|uniref:sensor histidine kinase n=1 Tax=Nitrincola salilacus TaxID=3400273 RepID=UPI0039181518
MITTLIQTSLSKRFLSKVLPVLFIASVVFLAVLAWLELEKAQEVNAHLAQQKVNNLSRLLTEPVWQLAHSVSENILETTLEDPSVGCVSLEHASGGVLTSPPLQVGICENSEAGWSHFTSSIVYSGPRGDHELGTVSLHADVSSSWQDITGQLWGLALLVAILFLALVTTTTLAFRWTILRPLNSFSESLKHYQNTGKRLPVDWQSRDELGLLINEYNATLQLQSKTERQLSEAKDEAEQALASLKEAQDMLIQTEKLASLGRLVAGIAHEINTPVGNSRTVVTALGLKVKMFNQELESGLLKRSSLDKFLASLDEAIRILDSSLDMAAEQISNFKQVAVDQTSTQQRRFDLKEVVDEVIYTLRPRIKHTRFNVEVDVPEGIELNSFPGPLGQIITNCFNNALIHGFEGRDEGCITISARRKGEHDVMLEISDDGIGMSAAELKKAFDPFFTTKMGRGGSGLGLHIVFNLVNTVLRGSVELDSAPGKGLKLMFRIPVQVLADA